MRRRTNLATLLVISIFLVMIVYSTASGKTIYVDDDAPPGGNGQNWSTAYKYLQDAIDYARDHYFEVSEIKVAKGTYKPDKSSTYPYGTRDRTATFRLRERLAIRGGYAGLGQPNPDARDIVANETILSGDLNGNDIAVVDTCDLLAEPTRAENSYHVVYASLTFSTAVIDGLAITAGNANGSFDRNTDKGGGMYCWSSTPTLTNCTFVNNSADYSGGGIHGGGGNLTNCTFRRNATGIYGGGIYNYSVRSTITNCTFSDNYANSGGGIYNRDCNDLILDGCRFNENTAKSGGGMDSAKSSPILMNCTFNHNLSHGSGGGMESLTGSPTLINCIFTGNVATTGGGICSGWNILTLNKCTFSGNRVYNAGGGIFNINCTTTVTNCTFVGNSAPQGNTLACDSYGLDLPSEIQAISCILWDGSNQIWNNDNSIITIEYSDTDGGWPGEGNIDVDPCFAAPGYWDTNGTPEDVNDDFWFDGDYHLKSQGGRWDVNSESWIKDDTTSPCVDAGDPMSPIGPELFPNGGIINMGTYGGTEEASKSYFGEPVCETAISGDINGDCRIDFLDFRLMILNWLEDNTPPPPPLPGKALYPNPDNGAIDVNTLTTLSWTCGSDATSHNVYFGTNPTPDVNEFQGNQTSTFFDPCGMAYSTKYYWRVDEINVAGKSTGIVWNFTTLPPFPGQASEPNPTDGAIDVDSAADLRWTTGHDALSHDVYYGVSFPLTFMGNQTTTAFDPPGLMSPLTKYNWRIDGVNSAGKNKGPVWSFTTKESIPPPPM